MSQGGEKTEKATPKKRRDARERGQVMKSQEVITAFCMVVMFGFLLLYSSPMIDMMLDLFRELLGSSFMVAGASRIGQGEMGDIFLHVLLSGAKIAAPILGVALFAGFASNVLQVGFLFTTKALTPKFERISPMKGFKRIFSVQTLVTLIKSLLKVIVLGYIFYGEYKGLLAEFPSYMGVGVYAGFMRILKTAFTVALKMAMAMVVIAAADFLFQWFKFEKDLRMTKQEVKDEYKLMEGDPQIKSKIRQKQRQMSMMRMMQQVPTADVVITNPTHFAVAIKYDDKASGAPVVVAKGQDFTARKIRETALEHKVQIVENKPLAQALYHSCEIGQEIPEELYQAVAEVLVFVFRQKERGRGAPK